LILDQQATGLIRNSTQPIAISVRAHSEEFVEFRFAPYRIGPPLSIIKISASLRVRPGLERRDHSGPEKAVK